MANGRPASTVLRAGASLCPAGECMHSPRGAQGASRHGHLGHVGSRAHPPPGRGGDSPILPKLPGQIPEDEQTGTVTADGACDTRRCHSAIIDRQATPFGHSLEPMAFVPSLRSGKTGAPGRDCPAAKARNETLRATRHYGRAFRKHWTGYHTRSRVEAAMRCLKALGERIASDEPPTAKPPKSTSASPS